MENQTAEIKLTTELLGLTDVEIQEVILTRDNTVFVRVKSRDRHQRDTQASG